MFNQKQKKFQTNLIANHNKKKAQTINNHKQTMKIHFLLLALVAVVALSQHNVDARVDGLSSDGFRPTRTLAEHRLLDHFLKRSLYGLEESDNEENEKDQESGEDHPSR